jgi:DNA polymerase-3 subunit epsilon
LVVKEWPSKRSVLSWSKIINPGIHIPAVVVAIHGITDADVIGKPSLKEVAPALVKLIGKLDILVGHNLVGFDIPLLANELARVEVPVEKFPFVVDTTEARWATDNGKMPTLGELCYALDTPYDTEAAHRALYDVEVNLDAYFRGLEIGAFQLPELVAA